MKMTDNNTIQHSEMTDNKLYDSILSNIKTNINT